MVVGACMVIDGYEWFREYYAIKIMNIKILKQVSKLQDE
jgi:hypothetical protein